MVETAFLNEILDKHGLEIVIGVGSLIGFMILYKKLRSIPKQPDHPRIMAEKMVEDESLNKLHKLNAKWLYRGEEKIGRILTTDTKKYNYTPSKEELDTKAGMKGWEMDITTIVFKPKDFMGLYLFSGKKLVKFKESEASISENHKDLIFSSDMGFTALGNVYMTKTSYTEISNVVEAEWSKRLLESNVNIMASKMSHIAAETPEAALELSLKRLEIEKISAEKQAKVGGLI